MYTNDPQGPYRRNHYNRHPRWAVWLIAISILATAISILATAIYWLVQAIMLIVNH